MKKYYALLLEKGRRPTETSQLAYLRLIREHRIPKEVSYKELMTALLFHREVK